MVTATRYFKSYYILENGLPEFMAKQPRFFGLFLPNFFYCAGAHSTEKYVMAWFKPYVCQI